MRITLLAAILFFVGCGPINRPEFVDFAKSHRDLVNHTNPAIINTIMDELSTIPNLSIEDRAKIMDLVDRLTIIIRQSDLIYQYVISNSDEEIIAELVRNGWSRGKK